MACLKLFLLFILIVIALNKKIKAGHVFIFAAVLFGLAFGLPLSAIPKALFEAVIAPHTLSLTLIIACLLVLSNSMHKFGNLTRMLDLAKATIKNYRFRLVLFPIIIGLLPMPGGAIFSAPMVKELTKDSDFSSEDKAYINYWFRHIWEYWWPLYPGMILMVTLSGLSVARYSLFACSLSVLALIYGFVSFPKVNSSELATLKNVKAKGRLVTFLKELVPILIAIGVGMSLGKVFEVAFPKLVVGKEIGLCSAIVLACFYTWFTAPKTQKNRITAIKECIFDKHVFTMAYTAFGVMVFQGLLKTSQAIDSVTFELMAYNISVLAVCLILPFIAGLVTGISIGYVSTSFPIVLALLTRTFPETDLLPYIILSVVFGFVGTLFSPLHICLILTNEYFGAKQGAVIKLITRPCLLMLLSGLGYFFLLK